jgi:3-methyladenine DNA glycosylase Tag
MRCSVRRVLTGQMRVRSSADRIDVRLACAVMEHFARIEKRAIKHVGSVSALEELLPKPKGPRALARTTDDRCLAAIARAIFAAGFQPKIVEHMWPGIEDAMHGFDPMRVARLTDAQIEKLLADDRVVRHEGKLLAIRDTARFVVKAAAEHGGFGKLLGRWPNHDVVGLWDVLRKGGARIGWSTAAFALRELGKDTFVLGRAVCEGLVAQGVVDKPPSARRALAATQEAFNTWAEQSGRPLCQLSKVLALSVAA